MQLAEANQSILEALQRLAASPPARRAFVIITVAKTNQFVQFKGSANEPLLADLPAQQLRKRNGMTDAVAMEAASALLTRHVVPLGLFFQKECLGPHEATAVAMAVLRTVLRVGEDWEVTITEDDSPISMEN